MNFKDLYKSANDSIHADKSLIGTIFVKAGKKPNYRYASIALAAAAVVLVIALYPSIATHHEDKIFVTDSRTKTDANTQKSPPEQSELSESKDSALYSEQLPGTFAEAPDKANEKSKEDEQNPPSKAPETSSEMNETVYKEDTDDAAPTEESDYFSDSYVYGLRKSFLSPKAENDTGSTDSGSRSSGGGSGGGSAAGGSVGTDSSGAVFKSAVSESSVNDENFRYLSPEEYFSYLGTGDVTKAARLPNDMYFLEFTDASVTESSSGEIISDNATICAVSRTDDKRFIDISITKLGGEAKTALSKYPPVNVGGAAVVITHDGQYTTAYFEVKNVYFKVLSGNVAQEQLEALIASLVQL